MDSSFAILHKPKEDAYIGLGSNLGDRISTLTRALELIKKIPATEVVRESGWYESEAVGGIATQDFVNSAVHISTSVPPRKLMELLLRIELQLGRERFKKWGDRTCDLDLLVYGQIISTDEDCLLPHPGIAERRFVLVPLVEIDAGLIVPGKDKNVLQLLSECEDPHWVRKFGSDENV